MKEILYVFAGGGTGSVVRYLVGLVFRKNWPALAFPWHTLLANVLACLVFALVLAAGRDKWPAHINALLLAGFCGGLSTFSTFGYETFELTQQHLLYAVLNILVSVVLCVGIFWAVVK